MCVLSVTFDDNDPLPLSLGYCFLLAVAVPPSSLRLLVPPIRLMAAEMWQVVQRCQVVHYGKLEEFVRLVAEVFPDILCQKEMFLLILGLRGRVGYALRSIPAVYCARQE